jgi:hypothetical protein
MEPKMTQSDDRAYYEARARQERVIAARCEDNAVALAHLRMADEYDRRIARIGSTLRDVTPSSR